MVIYELLPSLRSLQALQFLKQPAGAERRAEAAEALAQQLQEQRCSSTPRLFPLWSRDQRRCGESFRGASRCGHSPRLLPRAQWLSRDIEDKRGSSQLTPERAGHHRMVHVGRGLARTLEGAQRGWGVVTELRMATGERGIWGRVFCFSRYRPSVLSEPSVSCLWGGIC